MERERREHINRWYVRLYSKIVNTGKLQRLQYDHKLSTIFEFSIFHLQSLCVEEIGKSMKLKKKKMK